MVDSDSDIEIYDNGAMREAYEEKLKNKEFDLLKTEVNNDNKEWCLHHAVSDMLDDYKYEVDDLEIEIDKLKVEREEQKKYNRRVSNDFNSLGYSFNLFFGLFSIYNASRLISKIL